MLQHRRPRFQLPEEEDSGTVAGPSSGGPRQLGRADLAICYEMEEMTVAGRSVSGLGGEAQAADKTNSRRNAMAERRSLAVGGGSAIVAFAVCFVKSSD